MQADPAVLDVTTVLGGNNNSGSVGNQSSLFVDLKPLGDGPDLRKDSVDTVIQRLNDQYKHIADIRVTVTSLGFFNSGSTPGGGQYGFNLTSTTGVPLQQPVLRLAQILRKMKQFRDVTTGYDTIGKQQMLQVDRDAASRLQVGMGQIDQALSNAFSQVPVSVIYSDINQYQVVLTATDANSLSPSTLLNTYVRNSQGKLIQLAALARIVPSIAPVAISHYKPDGIVDHQLQPDRWRDAGRSAAADQSGDGGRRSFPRA